MKTDQANGELVHDPALPTALLDLAHDCLLVRDREGRITLWNRSAAEVYGWTAAEALGQVAEDLLKTQCTTPLAELKAIVESSGSWKGELVQTARDGRVLIMSSHWMLQRDTAGAPLAILESSHDISERRYAEEALRLGREQLELRVLARTADLASANEALVESQNRFRQMAETIPEVFWLSNPRMTSIIYVSPAYEQIWGRSSQPLYENPGAWFEAIHPDDQQRARQIFRQPIPPGGYENTYRIARPDGAVRWILERGVPVPDNAGRVMRLAGVARDITNRKLLEEETLAISEREQQRIGQDLHDDLCQQLVGIEFISKALQQKLTAKTDAARAGEIARLIREAINHTRRLARGLAPVQLEAEGLMGGLRDLAARTTDVFRIQCSFHCPEAVLLGDSTAATHLYRIAQEAVTNGIKHGQAKNMEIGLSVDEAEIVLRIEDDGVGLSTQPPGGQGMGLRIMQYRAGMVGGTVSVHSAPKGGTVVTCAIPISHRQRNA